MKRALIFLLFTQVFSVAANEQGVLITRGFVSGQAYVDASAEERAHYVMGLIDGMLVSPMLDARIEKRMIALSRCLSGKTADDLDKMMMFELRATPAARNESAHRLMHRALMKLDCR